MSWSLSWSPEIYRALVEDRIRELRKEVARGRGPRELVFQKHDKTFGVKWITGKNADVDRIACPWLIKRFVDKDPVFIYVPVEEVVAAAARENAIPYDVKDVELSDVDGRCSFESFIVKYNLTDPALQKLAKIIHGADGAADINNVPEAAGLKAIAYGFASIHSDNNHEKIRLETPLYDALYAWCQRQVAVGR